MIASQENLLYNSPKAVSSVNVGPSHSQSSDVNSGDDLSSLGVATVSASEDELMSGLEGQFGIWEGRDSSGKLEKETWIGRIPGVLCQSVIVKGLIVLTNRRLCYLADIPPIDKGQVIRSGSATHKAIGKFHKKGRHWFELRTDSLTQYPSSTELFRPLQSLRLSEIKKILPCPKSDARTISLRLVNGKLMQLEFDTAETTLLWYNDFVTALFSYKTQYSNQIRIMLPLRRIKKMHRNICANVTKILTFEIDSEPSSYQVSEREIVEQKYSVHLYDRPRVELSYFLAQDPFDDTIIDAIVRAKLEIPSNSTAHSTPDAVFEVPNTPSSVEELSSEHNDSSSGLRSGFIKAFALDSDEELPIYSCALLRTFPMYGRMALSQEFCCFWRRGTILTPEFKLRIPLRDVGSVRESGSFGFNRFGIALELAGTTDIRFDFSSKSTGVKVLEAFKSAINLAKHQEKISKKRRSLFPPLPLSKCVKDLKVDSLKSKHCPVVIGDLGLENQIKPMKITCMTIGSRGDVQPYISLARRLMQDGHTVTIASHPEYRTWVESFGILYKEVGGDPGALMKLSVDHAFFTPGFFREALSGFREWLGDLLLASWKACCEAETELLIESPSTFTGIHIAEALQIPYFRAFTMTWTSTSAYPQAFASSVDLGPSYNLLSYSMFDNLLWRAMAGQVNKWRKNVLTIPPTSLEKFCTFFKVPFLYNFSSVVVPRPLDWRDHIDVTGYWFLDNSHGNYKPPDDLVDFIASARREKVPLVYIGFGSVTVPNAAATTKAINGAVVQAGVRAIVAKGWSERASAKAANDADSAISLPDSVYVVQAIPHDWLFPQVDAVCHHGGAGTTGISLRFGVPTLIHPFFGDQTFWAERVAKLGAGLRVDSLTVNQLSDALIRATSDSVMKEKAAKVGERIRAEDGPARAVQFIYQHLEFALDRTLHRIERTKPKKYWSTGNTRLKSPVNGSEEENKSQCLLTKKLVAKDVIAQENGPESNSIKTSGIPGLDDFQHAKIKIRTKPR
ncbi:expressed protein [Phakopsora pachyrhizi]|uniref:sterol 3beta-glucosyltransferase n=1 Tax=Phakopsora pachyrhizi TaxID=170000 RepID=A0AAV0B268_PHAPC|nr:expressed protein [Phakopsora pachyrhizi]